MVKEYFEHRADKLNLRVHNHRTGWITEYFHPGRLKQVKGNNLNSKYTFHNNVKY